MTGPFPTLPHMAPCGPSDTTPVEVLRSETRRLEIEARWLYRRYVLAVVAAGAAFLLLLFTVCEPLLAPLFGDTYFFGSSTF